MPNATLTKADKIHALRGMVQAKFQARHQRLMNRRAELTQQVYDETLGKTGYALRAAAGKEWQKWCRVHSGLYLPEMPFPYCLVETGKRPTMYRHGVIDQFGVGDPENYDRVNRLGPKVSLKNSVVMPSDHSEPCVLIKDASANARKKAGTLKRDILRFNRDAKQFYRDAYDVLMQIRSTRKVDEMFPELWKYLPEGTREKVKQAVIMISQEDVDRLRKQLP